MKSPMTPASRSTPLRHPIMVSSASTPPTFCKASAAAPVPVPAPVPAPDLRHTHERKIGIVSKCQYRRTCTMMCIQLLFTPRGVTVQRPHISPDNHTSSLHAPSVVVLRSRRCVCVCVCVCVCMCVCMSFTHACPYCRGDLVQFQLNSSTHTQGVSDT